VSSLRKRGGLAEHIDDCEKGAKSDRHELSSLASVSAAERDPKDEEMQKGEIVESKVSLSNIGAKLNEQPQPQSQTRISPAENLEQPNDFDEHKDELENYKLGERLGSSRVHYDSQADNIDKKMVMIRHTPEYGEEEKQKITINTSEVESSTEKRTNKSPIVIDDSARSQIRIDDGSK
jgi:hypothetical protein